MANDPASGTPRIPTTHEIAVYCRDVLASLKEMAESAQLDHLAALIGEASAEAACAATGGN